MYRFQYLIPKYGYVAYLIDYLLLICVMETFFVVFALLLLSLGLIGSVLPILPGVPLSYLGIIVLHSTDKYQFSSTFLIFWLIVVIVVQVLDFIIPIIGAQKYGASKAGVWGSSIGMICGFLFAPIGIILGPFLGALFGEMLTNKPFIHSLKAAWGALIAIVFGTVLKLIVAGLLLFYAIKEFV